MEDDLPMEPAAEPAEHRGPLTPAVADEAPASLDFRKHMELMQEYREAIRITTQRFESLGAQARARMQHNPVHSVSSRLKSPTGIMEKLRRKGLPVTEESIRLNVRDVAGVRVVCPYINDIDTVRLKSPTGIMEKLRRKGLPVTEESIRLNVRDVAGVRVVCPYINDIDTVAEFLLSQDDVDLIARKDYVENPKESGYRSLHLVVALKITLEETCRELPVEVQIRTIAMDFWASLEHQLRYKNRAVLKDSDPLVEDIRSRLESCARQIARLDRAMQRIQLDIDELPFGQEDGKQ